MRVLLVEDEPVVALGLQSMIRDQGFDVVGVAQDGQSGLDMIRSLKPDVAVVDVKLPVMDGLAMAKAAMTESPLPVVVLTAYADKEFVEEAARVGAFGYIVKPASADTLLPTIKMAVARFNELRDIRHESEENRQALETRKLVERAKYILMARLNLNEEAAFAHIRDKCRNQNKTMKETAIEILEADAIFMRSVEKAPLSKIRY
jgi:response regulator NasT